VAGEAGISSDLTVGGTATVSSDLTLSGTGANLYVGTGGTFDNDSELPDAYVRGNLEVDGNCYLGDAVTDTLTVSSVFTMSGDLTMSGTNMLYLADGTASAPSLTFEADTDTGLYRLDTDKIGLITGGTATQGITIDSSGNVGIGTTSPGANLEVSGATSTISNSSGNINIQPAGNLSVNKDIAIPNTQKVILDSDDSSDTYIVFDAGSNYISIYVDNEEVARFEP
jgi:hypothetical protein